MEVVYMPRKPEPLHSNFVREFRTEANLTQQALADKVSVTRQTIVAMEAGSYVPSLPLAIRLARVFKRSVEQVFKLNE
jgi:putative transcriptional regulator